MQNLFCRGITVDYFFVYQSAERVCGPVLVAFVSIRKGGDLMVYVEPERLRREGGCVLPQGLVLNGVTREGFEINGC